MKSGRITLHKVLVHWAALVRGDDLYRRSLYTYWKRAVPPPSLLTFDAPTREYCALRRSTTNTPLQALVLWNDVQFVEAARVLAQKSFGAAEMFRHCVGRSASAFEQGRLEDALKGFQNSFSENPESATLLLEFGDAPLPAEYDAVQLAAHTMLANAILSLDEGGEMSLVLHAEDKQEQIPLPRASLPSKILGPLLEPQGGDDRWYRAVRTTEFSETIPYCLRRGRTVDIPVEPPSENRSFKGAMSIASCGILLAILGLLFAFAIFEGFLFPARYTEYRLQQQQTDVNQSDAEPKRSWFLRIWPVYPILLFLLLQFLLVLARKKPPPAPIPSPGRTD